MNLRLEGEEVFQGLQTEVCFVSLNDLNLVDRQQSNRAGWEIVKLQFSLGEKSRAGRLRGVYQGDEDEGLQSVDGSVTLYYEQRQTLQRISAATWCPQVEASLL